MPDNKVNGFLEYLEKERSYSPHTIKAYETDLIQFSRFVKEYSGTCLLYTSPSPRAATLSRMPSSA